MAKYVRDPRSEQDVINVTDLVAEEYNVDRNRIYLLSVSHGGAAEWYLGETYPDRWAAIAISNGAISPDGYPFERLTNVPVLVSQGTLSVDQTVSYDAAYKMFQAAKEKGVNAEFFAVLDGTHLESWSTDFAFNKILDFFDKHTKAANTK